MEEEEFTLEDVLRRHQLVQQMQQLPDYQLELQVHGQLMY